VSRHSASSRLHMNMEWKDIFELFLDRTLGAVRTRRMLQGKRSVAATTFPYHERSKSDRAARAIRTERR
jgi:hypothetical protein